MIRGSFSMLMELFEILDEVVYSLRVEKLRSLADDEAQ